MTRKAVIVLAVACGLAACDRGGSSADDEAIAEVALPKAIDAGAATPMAEREAVLGLLNKRNGIVRELKLKPGQSIRVNDVIVRLRACEATAPWELEKLTGAFVQVDVQRPDQRWDRVFSGWLYKESPSLNVVEHPVYDVWPKSCAMSWPGAGELAPSASDSSSRSSAANSGGGSDDGSTQSNSGQPEGGGEGTPDSGNGSEPSAEDSNAE